jgi:hypothetical protein
VLHLLFLLFFRCGERVAHRDGELFKRESEEAQQSPCHIELNTTSALDKLWKKKVK